MAHSIQEFGGQSEIFSDADLLVVLGFAINAIRKSKRFARLAELAGKWEKQIELYGPGCIDLELQSLYEDPESLSAMVFLFESVGQEIQQNGDTVPADVMKALPRPVGVEFSSEYKTALLRDAIQRILRLLQKSQS